MKIIHNFFLIVLLVLKVINLSAQTNLDAKGTLVVLNKTDYTAMLIDVTTGKNSATIPVGTEPHEVIVSPDGKTAVVANTNYRGNLFTLSVIDIPTMKVTNTINLGNSSNPHGIVYLPDGKRIIVTTEGSREMVIVDIINGKVESRIKTGNYPTHLVVISKDGKFAYGSSIASANMVKIDLTTNKMVGNVQCGGGAEGFDISPDGREVWVANRYDNTINVINTKTMKKIELIKVSGEPIRLKFTNNGKYALISNLQTGEVAAINTKTRKIEHTVSMAISAIEGRQLDIAIGNTPAPIGLVVSPNGKYAYVATSRADIVTVIDLVNWKIASRFPTGVYPDGMSYSKIVLKK